MTPGGAAADRPSPGWVAVVGMHRSGTSATAGLLVGMGLAGPRPDDLVAPDPSNARGHFESRSAHLLNVQIVAALGGTTFSPPPPRAGWQEPPGLGQPRLLASDWAARNAGARALVLKDPRLCLTLPLWREVLPGPCAAVLVLRDPLEVAGSLRARDGLPVTLGLALWDRYMRWAVLGLEGLPTLVVDYGTMLAEPDRAWDELASVLRAARIAFDPTSRRLAQDWLEPGMRHQSGDSQDDDHLAAAPREVLAALDRLRGFRPAWETPDLPAAPSWVEDVLELRRELTVTRHELYWTKRSRAFRVAASLWRLGGGGPRASSASARSGSPAGMDA